MPIPFEELAKARMPMAPDPQEPTVKSLSKPTPFSRSITTPLKVQDRSCR